MYFAAVFECFNILGSYHAYISNLSTRAFSCIDNGGIYLMSQAVYRFSLTFHLDRRHVYIIFISVFMG